MRTLLVAVLLLSLVASIYSQQLPDPPSASQLQCIADESTSQAQGILNDCANVNFDPNNVRMCCVHCLKK